MLRRNAKHKKETKRPERRSSACTTCHVFPILVTEMLNQFMANNKIIVVCIQFYFNSKKDNRLYFSFDFDKNELPAPSLDNFC